MTRMFELEEMAMQINLSYQAAKTAVFQLACQCATARENCNTNAMTALTEIIDVDNGDFVELASIGEGFLRRRITLHEMLPDAYHHLGEPKVQPHYAFRAVMGAKLFERRLLKTVRSEAEFVDELNRMVSEVKSEALQGVPKELKKVRWPYSDDELLISTRQTHAQMKTTLEAIGLGDIFDRLEKLKNDFDAANGVGNSIYTNDKKIGEGSRGPKPRKASRRALK